MHESGDSRVTFKHILVPTDFGPASEHALDSALALATQFSGAVAYGLRLVCVPVPILCGWRCAVGHVWSGGTTSRVKGTST